MSNIWQTAHCQIGDDRVFKEIRLDDAPPSALARSSGKASLGVATSRADCELFDGSYSRDDGIERVDNVEAFTIDLLERKALQEGRGGQHIAELLNVHAG